MLARYHDCLTLNFSDISIRRGTRVLFEKASFNLFRGEKVGITGENGSGKSSLLATVSHARPRIGAFAFSTIEPELGVVEHGYDRLTWMDIPGLLEGASEGVGMGEQFLQRAERAQPAAEGTAPPNEQSD